MNESDDEYSLAEPKELNPYHSPGIVEPENIHTASEAWDIHPSPKMVGIGLGIGLVIQSVSQFRGTLLGRIPFNDTIEWAVVTLLLGSLMGLGIALLWDAVARRKFPALMPGHWCLIALIPSVVGSLLATLMSVSLNLTPTTDIGEMVNRAMLPTRLASVASSICLAAFFAALVGRTREPLRWKIYAGINVFYWLILMISQLVILFAATSDMESTAKLGIFFVPLLAGSTLAALIAIIAGALIDQRMDVRRDIYHWIGLLQVLVIPLIIFAVRLFPRGGEF